MRKTTVSSTSFAGFLSPGAINYADNKGWSSERVPHPTSTPTTTTNTRRPIGSSSSALTTPFYSGRTIPSKWEDAERWICSPVPTVCQTSSEQRRQKSKSGPIGPLIPHPPPPIRPILASSPFSTGVLEADRVFRGHGHSRSCVDLMSEESSSLSSKTFTEEKAEDTKEGEMMTTAVQSPVVSRRDIATQMSSEEEETSLTPKVKYSTLQELHYSQMKEPPPCRGEVREVRMDKGAKMIKHPKRRVVMSNSSRVITSKREQEQQPPEVEDSYEESSSSWDISEPAITLSKLNREEAKIIAWENLQKAKAEAAIRKLEVKLEKKKSASMDKILNKLQSAKLKAQEMRRSSVSTEQEQQQQISRHSVKITHLVRRHSLMSPFLTCFAPRVDCTKSSSAL